MMKKTLLLACLVSAAAFAAQAQTVVDVTGSGADKKTVSIDVDGALAPAFVKSLKRNLEISGCFAVRKGGTIKVSGTVGGQISAVDASRSLSANVPAADEKEMRMAVRRLSDAMCEAFAAQKGFACDKIVFVSRKGPANSELCICYPDGRDIRQLTRDARISVGPRWKNSDSLFYTGFLGGGPQIWEFDTRTNKREMRWSFKGLSTGATMSPDGSRVAIILSFQGNPELYVIDVATSRWIRMTTTPNASEGQPCWSPDGKSIVYVSNEARRQHLYIVDVATKKKRRLTSKGTQNIDPDWGPDGRIAYITKRGGLASVAIIDPGEGESSARLVTKPGSWEHPSWARDRRHVVAGRDKALFIVDTAEDGDDPVQLFYNNGNWITPSWSR